MGSEFIIDGLNDLSKNKLSGFDKLANGSIYSIISLMHSEQSIAGASSYPMAVYFNKKHAECGANYLSNSIKLTAGKKNKIYQDLINNLYKKKLIEKNNIKALIKKIDYFFNFFKINKVHFDNKEKMFLVDEIKKMKMLEFSSVKFSKKDIFNFLNNEY